MDILQSSLVALWKGSIDIGVLIFSQIIANISAFFTGITGDGASVFNALLSLVLFLIQITLLLFIFKVLQMIWFLLHEVRFMWKKPQSYSALRTGGKRILVVGDSTAYGVGASRPEDSISGRLGRDFPRTEIINTAVGGSLTREAIEQLHRAPGTFDLIIICTGGNDIWHFTRPAPLEKDLERLLKEAIEKSNHQVILLFYANLGSAPIFPSFIRTLLGKKTQEIHDVFSRVSGALRVPLVELYTKEKVNDFSPNPFLKEPEKYYSQDRMHPSSEGYRLWYNHMWGEMVAHHFTFAEAEPVLFRTEEQDQDTNTQIKS